MFLMTADIFISSSDGKQKFEPIKPHSVSWKRNVDNYSDSCRIKIPGVCMMKKEGDGYSLVSTGLQLKEGMKVEFYCGYDHKNVLRFKGFIRRRNFTLPLELECEGYAYQLRLKKNYSRSFKNTTVKKILIDLVVGTDIKLSDKIPDIPIPRAYFKNVNGIDVIDWLKEKCLLTVYFNFDTLYCGLREAERIEKVNFRLGWNVIKDNELKFELNRELATVNIRAQSRKRNGAFEEITVGDGGTKTVVVKFTVINDPVWKKKIAEDVRTKLTNQGYEGSITAFLIPLAEPGMTADIDDMRYKERKGDYFIEGVDGDFGPNGGRQKIKIGNYLGNG